MASAADLQLQIKVGTDGLVNGLKIATSSVKDAAALMQAGMTQIGAHTKAANDHTEGFISTLKEFKAEQTANARTANFFATQLTELVPGADSAKGALKGLIEIGLEGFGIGAAMELAKFAIGQLAAAVEENEKRANALKRAFEDTAASVGKAFRNIRDNLAPANESIKAWRSETERVAEENRKATQAADEYYRSFSASLRDTLSLLPFVETREEKRAKMLEENAARLKALEAARADFLKTSAEEDAKSHRKRLSEQLVIEAATGSEIQRIRAELASKIKALDEEYWANYQDKVNRRRALERNAAEEIRRIRVAADLAVQDALLQAATVGVNEKVRIQAEADQKVRHLEADLDTARRRNDRDEIKRIEDKIAIAQMLAQAQIQVLEEQRKQSFASEAATLRMQIEHQDEIQRVRTQTALKVRKMEADLAKETEEADHARLNVLIDLQKKAGDAQVYDIVKAKVQQVAEQAANVGARIGDVFAGLIAGTKSMGDAIKEIGKQIVSMVIQVAIKTVTARAAEAAAGGAASQAAIPLIGPFLAVGAAASMMALVMGLLGSIPSASGGWEAVPHDTMAAIHKDEMVLPKKYADIMRGLESGGGMNVTLNIQAMDGASVRRVVESRAFTDAMAEAIRNGRMRG